MKGKCIAQALKCFSKKESVISYSWWRLAAGIKLMVGNRAHRHKTKQLAALLKNHSNQNYRGLFIFGDLTRPRTRTDSTIKYMLIKQHDDLPGVYVQEDIEIEQVLLSVCRLSLERYGKLILGNEKVTYKTLLPFVIEKKQALESGVTLYDPCSKHSIIGNHWMVLTRTPVEAFNLTQYIGGMIKTLRHSPERVLSSGYHFL